MFSIKKICVLLFIAVISLGCASSKNNSVDLSPDKVSSGMSKNPNALYFYNTAERLSSAGNPDEALRYFSRAVKIDQKFSAAYMGTGLVYYQKDNEKALSYLNKALDVDKYNLKAYYNRAVILIQLERFKDAVNDFESVISLKPDYAIAYFNAARLYEKLEETESALNYYNKAIELDNDEMSFWFQRGIFRLTGKIGDKGLSDFIKIINLNPEDYNALYNAASVYSINGDFDKTIVFLKRALKAGFKDIDLFKKDNNFENFRRSEKFSGFWESIKK